MKEIESLIKDLPDAESARRFLQQFGEKNSAQLNKLLKNKGLLSDILTIFSYSPLLSTTILQNPNYISWLNRHRSDATVRDKEELLESLARFSMTNSQVEPNVLLARFRRRELLRIFLRDIRKLSTIAEITEEISNLADVILEQALRLAKQELNNRYGNPLETDEKGRAKQAEFCIVSLGKLGSKELNYSSDIDLLFIYSAEGVTSGNGSRGSVTNREYFVKLAEFVNKLVGQQTGEGAAYRVDMRLRPHGRVGALAISLKDTVRYYQNDAQTWERQVLIRSRASAGDAELFKDFFVAVEDFVFSKDESVENALQNVRLSKEKINHEHQTDKGFNVKLGKGGIREIEFIAQALQLAYGGNDEWLRVSHTLKSLSRLADRRLLTETELTQMFGAYEFLRRVEHLLQMENGLQTHIVPNEENRRLLVAKRMNLKSLDDFNEKLEIHSEKVNSIFKRVFGDEIENSPINKEAKIEEEQNENEIAEIDEFQRSSEISISDSVYQSILSSLEKSAFAKNLSKEKIKTLKRLSEVSPHFAEIFASNPSLIKSLNSPKNDFPVKNYYEILLPMLEKESDFARRLALLRKYHAQLLLEIVIFDVFEKIDRIKAKTAQTLLAEACLESAIYITKEEIEKRYSVKLKEFPFAVLGLGKLGGNGIDYGSDLDLVLVYDDEKPLPIKDLTHAEFYSRAVETFVTTLSSMTREGHLYRVDLRLRPDGKNGTTSIGKLAFLTYLENRTAIWEWLAYVKIRGVAGDFNLAEEVETKAREIIHQKAESSDLVELKNETWRIRERLEEEKSNSKKGKEIDIKFGAGGMLDIYFAMRFLQLRDNVPDAKENRATDFMLKKLREKGSLNDPDFQILINGYYFLTELDHNLRLIIGRSTRLPIANRKALEIIHRRMKLNSINDLLETLTFHRINIRESFEKILK